ncbi:MAG: LD-carboxypeptidase [Burkholderiales bacterium]|nr:LD-carboxypeptidase [Burkholderiales bacterium]
MARRPGIGFIAPSGQNLDDAGLARAADYFRARGYRVVVPAAARRAHQRFAGTDAERLAALHAMAARDDVDLVMAVRGGYGLTRLLDRIDYAALAAGGKTYIGHSDFTALLCAGYARARLRGIAGPTAAFDFGAAAPSAFTEHHFWRVIEGDAVDVEVAGAVPRGAGARIAGRLWGGNLAMLAHLAGTPYLPRLRGGILFVEDVNEHPYRVERMLYQLLHAGVLARQKALLLGDFSGYRLGPNDNGYDFEAMVAHLAARLPIPVLTGLPFGHVRDKLSLPFGARAIVEIAGDGYRLRYRAGRGGAGAP